MSKSMDSRNFIGRKVTVTTEDGYTFEGTIAGDYPTYVSVLRDRRDIRRIRAVEELDKGREESDT